MSFPMANLGQLSWLIGSARSRSGPRRPLQAYGFKEGRCLATEIPPSGRAGPTAMESQ